MNLLTIALVLALLAAVWWFLRKRREAAADLAATSIRRSPVDAEFHAVSIKFTGRACSAAKDMTGRRFLATAAPKLPLPGCDVLDCSCRFVHYKDRRANTDRRSPFKPGGVGGGTGSYDAEQRAGRDRRRDD